MRSKKFVPTKPISAEDAFQYALRALSARALTERELEKKLRLRLATPTIIADILTRLRELEFVNDTAIATRATEAINLGKFGIQRKLLSRGISKHVVEDALLTRDEDQDLAAITQLLGKYAKRFVGERAQHKAITFFMRRGFSNSVIRKALEHHEFQLTEDL